MTDIETLNTFWAQQELAEAFFEYEDGAITICLARDLNSPAEASSRRMTPEEAQRLINFIEDRCLRADPVEQMRSVRVSSNDQGVLTEDASSTRNPARLSFITAADGQTSIYRDNELIDIAPGVWWVDVL